MIIGLHFSGGPTAISWFIVAIVVYAVYAQFWTWPRPHIGQEVFKFIPTFTNLDSSATIAMPFVGFWISATKVHGIPDSIFWCPSPSMFERRQPYASPLDSEASTTFSIAGLKRMGQNLFSFAARTSTVPNCGTMLVYESKG